MDKLLQFPAERGTDLYTLYLSRLKRANAPIREHGIRRIFVACLLHLGIYNCSLFINSDCRTTDALAYLTKELSEINCRDETDFWLKSLFSERESDLRKISISPEAKNPKLDSLKEHILEEYEKNSESQGIVFCKTREITIALVNWMKVDQKLASLNPTYLMGTQKTGDGAFTRPKLEDALKLFKDGTHKLIVATSVAEEGLDVKKCNYIIRYEHVTNDIARVQARGRARAEEATSKLIADASGENNQHDEANKIREEMMIKGVEAIMTMAPADFKSKIETLQWKSKMKRDMIAQARTLQQEVKLNREHKDEYELRCLKCETFGAWSQDLRTIKQVHHVLVGDDGFNDRITLVPHPRPKKYDDWEKKAKIICKECGQEWGIKALHAGLPYCVLAICNFIIVDPNGDRKVVKKWKDVVFPVAELSVEDIAKMSGDDYEFRCVKCEAFGFWHQDLRTINNLHYVLIGDNAFKNRTTLVPSLNPMRYVDWEPNARILCKECNHEWGIVALYRDLPYYVPAVRNFIIVNFNGDREVIYSWGDVMFPVNELSIDDMNYSICKLCMKI